MATTYHVQPNEMKYNKHQGSSAIQIGQPGLHLVYKRLDLVICRGCICHINVDWYNINSLDINANIETLLEKFNEFVEICANIFPIEFLNLSDTPPAGIFDRRSCFLIKRILRDHVMVIRVA